MAYTYDISMIYDICHMSYGMHHMSHVANFITYHADKGHTGDLYSKNSDPAAEAGMALFTTALGPYALRLTAVCCGAVSSRGSLYTTQCLAAACTCTMCVRGARLLLLLLLTAG
jgi:hypothetical protein